MPNCMKFLLTTNNLKQIKKVDLGNIVTFGIKTRGSRKTFSWSLRGFTNERICTVETKVTAL